MATWVEVQEHLRGRFKLAVDQPSWIGLAWRFDVPSGGPLLQRQRIELAHASGQPHALVLCDVVPEDAFPPRDALVHNMALAIGALAVHEGIVVLRHLFPLDKLDRADFDRALELMAHEAARLRALRAGVHGNYEG